MVDRCTTCGNEITAKKNFVKFPCPNCGKETIVRCSTCKTLSNKYICKTCTFSGP